MINLQTLDLNFLPSILLMKRKHLPKRSEIYFAAINS